MSCMPFNFIFSFNFLLSFFPHRFPKWRDFLIFFPFITSSFIHFSSVLICFFVSVSLARQFFSWLFINCYVLFFLFRYVCATVTHYTSSQLLTRLRLFFASVQLLRVVVAVNWKNMKIIDARTHSNAKPLIYRLRDWGKLIWLILVTFSSTTQNNKMHTIKATERYRL